MSRSASVILSAAALAVAVVATPPHPAAAQTSTPPVAPPSTAINCDTAESDADLLVCAQRDLAIGEKQLAAQAQRITAALAPAAKPLFTEAQKAWTAYRDADCAWNAYDLQTGKMVELIRATCLADLTASRVEELEAGLGAQ